MEILKNNWNSTIKNDDEDEQKKILLKMAKKARAYTRRYGFIMYSTATLYFVSPYVGMQRHDDNRPRKYPFFGWYYYDRQNDTVYLICYALQVKNFLYNFRIK